MSNNIEQNGRQLSTEQAAPPTDPRTRGLRVVPPTGPTPEPQRICRDFVWGICSMTEVCKYRHELDYESMRTILKFCHDFQNRTGCTRPECTYLHASREEENLFLTSRVIPRVLAERYASVSAPSEPAPEPPSQIMYMSEYMPPPPPPPPPPSAQSSQSAPAPVPAAMPGAASMGPQMMPHMTGSMHPTMNPVPVCNMMPAPVPSGRRLEQPTHAQMPLTLKTNMHAVMPSMPAPVPAPMPVPMPAPMPSIMVPPPPPPPPPTLTTAPTQMAAPVYTAPQPMQHSVPNMYPISPCPQLQQPQQPTSQFNLPVLYDPSRPPPPIPVKRPAPSEPEAGPSKVLKLEDPIDSPCETCNEQNFRSALEQQEIEKLLREEEYRRRIHEEKTEEYENSNMLLKSMISPYMFRVVNEFMDMNTPTSDAVASSSSSSSTYNNDSATTVPKQFIFQLMEFLLNKRNEDTTSVEQMARRPASGTELMFASILELLQNGVASESRIAPLNAIGNNGLGRLNNGPLELAPPARYPAPAPAPAPPRYPAAVPYVPSNGEMVPPAAPYQPEPAPPPVYVPYQAAAAPAPAVPTQTPPRPYYQPYPAGGMSSVPYAPAAGVPPAAPAPAPAPAPAQPPTQPYQYMARMPQHYYPPYQ